MKKSKQKSIIATILITIILLIGGTTIILLNNKENSTVNTKYKESPYSLDEIYYLVEHPEKFAEENKQLYNEFAYVINHFYDYFSESTPMKTIRLDYESKNIESIEYIDYQTYMSIQKEFYQFEKEELVACKEDNREYEECKGINNRMWADRVVYGDSIYRTEYNKK